MSGESLLGELLKTFKAQLDEERKSREEQMKAQLDLIKSLQDNMNTSNNYIASTSNASSVTVDKSQLIATLSSRIEKFSYEPTSDYTFSKWYDRYGSIITVDGAALEDAAKVRLLLERLEERDYERYVDHIRPESFSKFSLDETVKTLREMFDNSKSLFTSRFECLQIRKRATESHLDYTGRVNRMCESAQLSTMTQDDWKSLLWLAGLDSHEDCDIRPRLLAHLDAAKKNNTKVTIQSLYGEWNKMASFKRDAQMIEQGLSQVNVVKRSLNNTKKTFNKGDVAKSAKAPTCYNCGRNNHSSKECRCEKVQCNKCHRMGHLTRFCEDLQKYKQKFAKSKKTAQPSAVNMVTKQISNAIANVNAARKYLKVFINDQPVHFQLDTGSDITLLNVDDWCNLGKPELQEAGITVKNASGGEIEILGKVKCDFLLKGSRGKGDAYITKFANLLGLEWIEQCPEMMYHLEQLTTVNQVKNTSNDLVTQLKTDFPTVFAEGLGTCTKEKAQLTLKKGAKPVYRPKRPVPYAAKEAVGNELNRLKKMGVIEPIDHSLWAAPIVVVRKANGKLRVCSDFSTGLNSWLEDQQYPLPIPDDIFATLNGGKVFAMIDLSDAYLQIELSEEAKELVVINTEEGLYRYNRLPFGIKTAPAIFQSIMNKMISGLPGVTAYLDDLIIVGKSEEELRDNIWKCFERIREYGFRVQIEKCSFMKKEVKYLGFIVDENGRRPNPEKIKAITEMPEPQDEKQLRSFLGMVNYYGQFVPRMKKLRGPLDTLLKKDTRWKWSKVEKDAFNGLKKVLTSDLNLTHYDPAKPLIVAADACDYGVGGVLLHKMPDGSEKPISHTARSLNPAEKNYAQIEKEGLGLIHSITKFHKYIYGRKFILRTDHKPLLAIFGSKKGVPIHNANRLTRWATMLLGYDFTIEYIQTDKFGYADGLSRLIHHSPMVNEDVVVAAVDIEDDVNYTLCQNLRALPITASDIKAELGKDRTLMQVTKMVQSGKWPKEKGMKVKLKPYFQRRDRLSVADNLLLDGERIIVPENLRMKILRELHSSHPGIERMRQLARGYVYWPNMDKEIEEFIKNCRKCQENAKTMVKVPLSPWPKPDGPWQRLHVDFAGPFLDKYFMIVVDAYSKWPEIEVMKKITAVHTVKVLTDMFSKYGNPNVIVSDNGTQFTSAEFNEMCIMNGIKHVRTAPYHPQSNGQAERFVDTLKRGMKKLKGEGVATEEAVKTLLLSYRSTPCAAIEGRSPAELFLGRKLRTRLSLVRHEEVPTELSENALSMKKQFDTKHGAKDRRFHKGDNVLVKRTWKNHWTWEHGKVIRPRGSVNYEVQTTRDRRTATYHANQMKSINQEDDQNQNTSSRWLEMMFDIFELPSRALPQAPSAAVPVTVTSSSSSSPVVPAAAPMVQRRGRGRGHGPAVQSVPTPPALRRSARTRRPVVKFDPSPQ